VPEPAVASVVIVNYRGRDRLGRCLDAISAAACETAFEVVVVDNASNDGSWDEAEGRLGVRLIRNDENVGFGRACNQAAALARGRHLVFLNYDCEPEPGWLDALVRCADDDPGVGAAQAVVLHPDETVNTAGNQLHYLGFSWAPNGGVAPTGPPTEVAVGSGACLLVPAHRFREVGGFWEAMFLYCEDTDLCWRLRLAGLRIEVCPQARVRHDYEFGRNTSKLYHRERNRLLMIAANYEWSTLSRLGPALLGTELALLVVAARGGWLPEKLRSLSSAARALPEVRTQRRAVSLLRRIPDNAFSRHLETRLGPAFGEGVARLSAPLLEAYARLARLN
jgi:N-acetylglucosaminyl-diphospho-decaprenol L-rhamnosyltransferase